ncbi:phosphotransferase enzyme family protein [Roseicitreum antarcticum]|uniref:Ser/Thr protein kinase RdoA involved in Cpx stress response, MazF antagonist n=1 Tax=Roseicitreum antarcticum TaxID=564137 RepID=A0A1H3BIT3_9RHOB|nr:phosphotransferase [Roseicitreum antarcticum]SDX41853.1 Ser/Thr protein kinase RdoA involved in Cpx stress response, MazF antagonist [Roseicitreum antarcticum]
MTPDLLHPFLHLWGLPATARVTLINVSENHTFRVQAPGRDLVLRLHRASHRSDAQIASELAWLDALHDVKPLRCARPLRAENGAALQHIMTPQGPRQLVAFEWIEGAEPSVGPGLRRWFPELGALTARLHQHAHHWARPADFTRDRWDIAAILGPEPAWGRWQDAPGLTRTGIDTLDALSAHLTERLTAYGTAPARFGLVHADLRLANLLTDARGLNVIDFDDCGFSWWIYDFAAAVSFIEEDPALPDLAQAWVAGYRGIADLPDADVAMLPDMVMLRRLLLTAWLGTRADSDTAGQFGGSAYTEGTVRLATRYLAQGAVGAWDRPWP